MTSQLSGFEATLQHATEWHDGDENIAGWYWSEKLDGVRARWTGEQLVTRNGNPVRTALDLTARLPSGLPLDIEIYAGRGRYETARQAAQLGRMGADVRLVVFDSPALAGDWLQRIRTCAAMGLDVPLRGSVHSTATMAQELRRLHKADGEGYMLARPGAAYCVGRTRDLLKFKHEAIYEAAGVAA